MKWRPSPLFNKIRKLLSFHFLKTGGLQSMKNSGQLCLASTLPRQVNYYMPLTCLRGNGQLNYYMSLMCLRGEGQTSEGPEEMEVWF